MAEDPRPDAPNAAPPETQRDYSRQLGVIEAFVTITRQCPNGAVRSAAERAIQAIQSSPETDLKEQAHFVLLAMQGWRGPRATQVRASLEAFIEG